MEVKPSKVSSKVSASSDDSSESVPKCRNQHACLAEISKLALGYDCTVEGAFAFKKAVEEFLASQKCGASCTFEEWLYLYGKRYELEWLLDDTRKAEKAAGKCSTCPQGISKATDTVQKCEIIPGKKSSDSNDSVNSKSSESEVEEDLEEDLPAALGDVLIKKSFDAYMVLEEDLEVGQLRLRETDNVLYRPS